MGLVRNGRTHHGGEDQGHVQFRTRGQDKFKRETFHFEHSYRLL